METGQGEQKYRMVGLAPGLDTAQGARERPDTTRHRLLASNQGGRGHPFHPGRHACFKGRLSSWILTQN